MMFLHKTSALLYNPLDYIKQIQLKYLYLLILMLIPNLVFAQDLFQIPTQDISIKMLNALFGGLVDYDMGIKNDPIMEPIKALNSGALIVGGVLAAYTILAGTVGTAHDGEMLGKKLSSVWVPIRYSMGTALVLPVIGGGYCVIQLLVMWVIVQGIGLANSVWSAYVTNSATMTGMIEPNLKDLQRIEELSVGIINAWSCNYMLAKSKQTEARIYNDDGSASDRYNSGNSIGEAPSGQAPIAGEIGGGNAGNPNNDVVGNYGFFPIVDNRDNQSIQTGYKWGAVRLAGAGGGANSQTGYPGRHYSGGSECGTVNFTKPANQAGTFAPNATVHEGFLGSAVSAGFKPLDVSIIMNYHEQQLLSLIMSYQAPSANIIANEFKESDALQVLEQVRLHSRAYHDGLKSAVEALTRSASWDFMTEQAREQGWMLAGAWFSRIIIINNSIRAAMNSIPYPSGGRGTSMSWIAKKMDKDLAKDNEKIILLNALLGTENSFARAQQMAKEQEEALSAMSTGSKSYTPPPAEKATDVNSIFDSITQALTGISMLEAQNDARHPIVILSELGHRLSSAVFAATVAVLAIGFVSGNALTVMNMFFGLPINTIIIIALTAEFVVPVLPYIIWLGALVGWLLLVVEAIIAAPLWAIMHLHPNGDDLTGRGGDGYKLALSLIFRPVLMVFGMIGALLISSIIGEFINKTFYTVFRNSLFSNSGPSALLGLIMGLFLYVSLMFTFVKKTFAIIHLLPDQLMRWMGGSTGGLGDMASGFQESAEKSSQGAAVLGGVAIGSGTKGALKGTQVAANRMVGQAQELGTAQGRKEEGGVRGAIQSLGATLSSRLDKRNAPTLGGEGKSRGYRNMEGARNYNETTGKIHNTSTNSSLINDSMDGSGGGIGSDGGSKGGADLSSKMNNGSVNAGSNMISDEPNIIDNSKGVNK